MKTLLCTCLVLSLWLMPHITATAQTTNWDTLPWKSYADYRLQLLNKSYMSTTVLYDRSFPIANVDDYTGYSNDTTSPDHFVQAYTEMYNAAYNTSGWLTPDSVNSLLTNVPAKNANPIGVFYYKFNALDTNAFRDNLVDTNANGQFRDVANRSRSPYFTFTSFIASPLLSEEQSMEQGTHVFYLDPQLFLHNEALTINKITVDFGDGQAPWVVNDPYNGGGSLKAAPGDGGATASGVGNAVYAITKVLSATTLIGRITVIATDILGRTLTVGNPFKIFVKSSKTYQELTQCKGGGQKWVIEAPQSRLAPINTQYGNPQVTNVQDRTIPCPVLPPFFPPGTQCHGKVPVKDTAYFYFANTNGTNCTVNTVKKPIVFLDGFDPTNSRDVKKIFEDYINVAVTRNGDPKTRFGDYMLNQGYDFIILDFKHGNDLLERNAMTVVSLLERLNQTYGSTMQQGITIVGPSMGSLIAQ